LTSAWTSYASGNALAVQLIGADDGEPFARLSVNIVKDNSGLQATSNKLPPNCFYAKAEQENFQIAQDCLESGWFEIRYDLPPVVSGFCMYDAWELRKEKGEPYEEPF